MSCKICGQGSLVEGGVIDHPFRHPYVDSLIEGDVGGVINNDKKKKSPPAAPAVGRGFGGDPALRLALVNAGVITHAQLLAAEEELNDARATGRPAVAAPQEGAGSDADSEDRFALGRGGS